MREDIYITWTDASPFFPLSTANADFVSLIENWPITNDDTRKANSALLSILETLKTNKTVYSHPGE